MLTRAELLGEMMRNYKKCDRDCRNTRQNDNHFDGDGDFLAGEK